MALRWVLGVVIILFGGVTAFFLFRVEPEQSPIPSPTAVSSPAIPATLPSFAPSPSPRVSSPRPRQVLLDVPFVSQAPTRSWEQPYQDACEEAALLSGYLWGTKTTLSPEKVHEELLRLVRIGETELGQSRSISTKRIHELARKAYPALAIRYVPQATLDDVKNELANGHVVLLPMAGRRLDGPFYRPPGPIYHALAMRGYDENAGVFIVNDPGTNTKGEAFRFSFEAIRRSWNDWDDARQELAGPEAPHPMLVVTR